MRIGKRGTLLLALALLGPIESRAQSALGDGRMQVTAFVGVTVLTMDRRGRLEDQTVMVRGDRIVRVAPRRRSHVPAKARVIDGRGRYLLPGLADMHVHFLNPDQGKLFLAFGVTTVRNMWGDDSTRQRMRAIASGAEQGPTIYSAGALIDGPGSYWPTAPVAKTPEDARRLVDETAAQGFIAAKFYDKLAPDVFRAGVAEARRRKLQVYVHVPDAMTIDEVLATGVDSIEHFEGHELALVDDWQDRSYRGLGRAWGAALPERMGPLAERIAKSGTWEVPTLVVLIAAPRAYADWSAALALPDMRYVPSDLLEFWRRGYDRFPDEAARISWQHISEAGHAKRLRMLRADFAAGVPLLIGSDTPNPFVVSGVSLHDEMAYFREAGLTSAQVLRIATSEAARFLHKSREFGVVAAGARADLLLADSDPERDLAVLRRPTGVMAAGRWYDRAALDRLLHDVAEKAAPMPKQDAIMPLGKP